MQISSAVSWFNNFAACTTTFSNYTKEKRKNQNKGLQCVLFSPLLPKKMMMKIMTVIMTMIMMLMVCSLMTF